MNPTEFLNSHSHLLKREEMEKRKRGKKVKDDGRMVEK